MENRRTLFAWQKRTQKGVPSIHLELLQHWRKRQQNGNNKMEKGRPGSSRQQTVKKETTTSIHPSIYLTSINESIEGHKRNLPSVENNIFLAQTSFLGAASSAISSVPQLSSYLFLVSRG
jgi:hypothetical protein